MSSAQMALSAMASANYYCVLCQEVEFCVTQVTSGIHYHASSFSCSGWMNREVGWACSLVIRHKFLSSKVSCRDSYCKLTLTSAIVHLREWIIDTSKSVLLWVDIDHLAPVDCSCLHCNDSLWKQICDSPIKFEAVFMLVVFYCVFFFLCGNFKWPQMPSGYHWCLS